MSTSESRNTQIDHVSLFTRTIVDINDLNKILKEDSNHGICGSCNLGNTCYMNSSIACLSNCTELTTYFLSGKFKQNINKKNKLGLGGRLANAWNELLKDYWNSKTTSGNPSNIKSYVAKKVKKFSGFNQHDSHEFMTEFLSLLNEDLNKTTKKSYRELKEKGEDEDDLKCAIRFWKIHKDRNDSVITDLFSGLLKSEVKCSKCKYNNITFDPSNTLTLPIPTLDYIKNKIIKHRDIEIFYIPKYSIISNYKMSLRILKDTPFKNYAEEINKNEKFKIHLNKLVFIKVADNQLESFIDPNKCKNNLREFIFAFDDLSKEGEKTKIIPLYMYKKKSVSAFPRLLFLRENMNFGELKKLIYYYARKYFRSPFANITNEDEKDEKKDFFNVDKEIEKYQDIDNEKDKEKDNEKDNENDKDKEKENNNDDKNKEKKGETSQPYDENKLWDLFEKEYDAIFNNKEEKYKEALEQFFNDFPYKISLKREFQDTENHCLFDGKNNYNNLKSLIITKDEDPITELLENENYCLNLIINTSSQYSMKDINLNSCQAYKSKDYGKKIELQLSLYNLLDFFCSEESLEKGNEWMCGKCKKRVNATKRLSIYYLPRLLIICIKRFSGSGSYYSKNGDLIDFPLENLDMEKYICENAPDKNFSKYDLFAVSQHYGGTDGGHYTAICKNVDGKWYNYDDSQVTEASPSQVVSSAAYVLFYRRQNW